MPIETIFAVLAASTPATESSKTTQFSGSILSNFAAIKNTSGSGFALLTSLPSTIASKCFFKSTLSNMVLAFLLADPNEIGCFFSINVSNTLGTSGNISLLSISAI